MQKKCKNARENGYNLGDFVKNCVLFCAIVSKFVSRMERAGIVAGFYVVLLWELL